MKKLKHDNWSCKSAACPHKMCMMCGISHHVLGLNGMKLPCVDMYCSWNTTEVNDKSMIEQVEWGGMGM